MPKEGYKVHYNGNGNTSGSMEDTECNEDENCVLRSNRYLKEGYVFKGWSLSERGNIEYTNGAKEFTDDENHKYCILKWMRE